MPKPTLLLVAKVTPTFAANNGLTFQDANGNYCVSMCYTGFLYTTEFVPIALDPSTNYSSMPVNPTIPIVH